MTTAPPGQYGCGGARPVHEQRLVDPGPGVRELRRAARAAPAPRVVARERAGAVDVAEDHVVGVDAQAVDDAPERGQARTAHLQAEHERRQRREAAAQDPPVDARHRRGAHDLGEVVPHRRQRARRAGDERLHAGERRAAGPLVLGRRRAVARHAAEQPAGDAVARLGQQVAVEVVAVGRVDPVGEPDAGVVDAHAARARARSRRARASASPTAGRARRARPARRSRAASGG